jgi:hypothetical protein
LIVEPAQTGVVVGIDGGQPLSHPALPPDPPPEV